MTLRELAAATGGRLALPDGAEENLVVDGPVSTDSRELGPGGLFVARPGELADGHEFVSDAVARGAVAALVTRPLPGVPCVVVEDTETAFGRVARAVVERAEGLEVVGITGSSGKTSTKDLLGTVLAAAGETIAPVGSYNSEVGVPLTVSRVRSSTRFLVAELGARGRGHIAYLAGIAPPRIGIVLNVGTAHMGEFGSREAIAVAKSELVSALPADGVAVLNADDAAVRAMAPLAAGRVVLVGESADADLRARDVSLDGRGRPAFTLVGHAVDAHGARVALGPRTVRLGLVGRHHVGNALSVVAAATAAGVDLDTITAGLESAGPVSRWRMEVAERPDGVTLVNDAYNANPDSMHAALDALAVIAAGRRSWAVLGTMLELGDESDALHAQVGADVVAHGVDELLVVGTAAEPMAAGARSAGDPGTVTRVRTVPDAQAARSVLDAELAPGDVALFKSSRDAGLRLLGDELAAPRPPEDDTRHREEHP